MNVLMFVWVLISLNSFSLSKEIPQNGKQDLTRCQESFGVISKY